MCRYTSLWLIVTVRTINTHTINNNCYKLSFLTFCSLLCAIIHLIIESGPILGYIKQVTMAAIIIDDTILCKNMLTALTQDSKYRLQQMFILSYLWD